MRRIAITVILLLLFVGACLSSHSCANTTTAPSGGPKDTIPPVLIKLTPPTGTTNFPTVGGKISLQYNEYTIVKTASDILLSPPTKRRPQAKVKGKNIVVTLQDTLRADQTYTIDFGNALVDNNEGNPAPRLVYAFSTGETLDSLYFTGTIIHSQTLQPVKGALVAAYIDQSDSACFKARPDAATKTDDWGYFVLRNLRDTVYQLFVYSDKDFDYKYNPDEDEIGFLDSLYHPTRVVNDSVPELHSFDMKDTLHCQARESMVTLVTFKELQNVQYLQNIGRSTERQGYLKFSAADVKINSLSFVGIPDSSVILQYNASRDSLDFWINTDYKLDDSLLIRLNYLKTDSTGQLAPVDTSLALAVKKTEEDSKAQKDKAKQAPDTVFKLQVSASDETVEQLGVRLTSPLPLLRVHRDSIVLTETNPKGQQSQKGFRFEQDSSDIRQYIITPKEALIRGYEYELSIPQGSFINLYKLPNEKTSAKFKVPQAENLSQLELVLTGVEDNYIVELTDEKGSRVLRTYRVDKPKTLIFPYLQAGKYMIRITCDKNRNGYADTGNLLARKQPEVVRFYETSPGNKVFEIPESAEIEQTVNLKSMFQ
jgi:hypothetical protein